MAVLRKNRRENYTVIDNAVFMDYSLSLKAKGLLCQMLSLPDGWEFSVEGLATLVSDGITSVRNALIELEEASYVKRTQQRSEAGKIVGIEYIVSETPMEEKPISENPISVNPTSENRPQLNTKELSTKELNTNTTNKGARFVKPTVEEVATYISGQGYHIDAEAFIDYYESNGWKVGRQSMKDWKAAVRTWERRRENGNGHDFRAGNTVRRGLSETSRGTTGTNDNNRERVRAKLPPMAALSNEYE